MASRCVLLVGLADVVAATGEALAARGFEPVPCTPRDLVEQMRARDPVAVVAAPPDAAKGAAIVQRLRLEAPVPVVVALHAAEAAPREHCLLAGAADVAVGAAETAARVAVIAEGWRPAPRVPWPMPFAARLGNDDLELPVSELGPDGLGLGDTTGFYADDLVRIRASLPAGDTELWGRLVEQDGRLAVRFLGLFPAESARLGEAVGAARASADPTLPFASDVSPPAPRPPGRAPPSAPPPRPAGPASGPQRAATMVVSVHRAPPPPAERTPDPSAFLRPLPPDAVTPGPGLLRPIPAELLTPGPGAVAPAGPPWPPLHDWNAALRALEAALMSGVAPAEPGAPAGAEVAAFAAALEPDERAWLLRPPADAAATALARQTLAARLCLGACVRAAEPADGSVPVLDRRAMQGVVAATEALLDALRDRRPAPVVAPAGTALPRDLGELRAGLGRALVELRTKAGAMGGEAPPGRVIDGAAAERAPVVSELPAAAAPAAPAPAEDSDRRTLEEIVAEREAPRPLVRAAVVLGVVAALGAAAWLLRPAEPLRLGPGAFAGVPGVVRAVVRGESASVDVDDGWACSPEDAARLRAALAQRGVRRVVVVDAAGHVRAHGTTEAPLELVGVGAAPAPPQAVAPSDGASEARGPEPATGAAAPATGSAASPPPP